MAPEKQTYSVKKAAEYLGITPATVRYHIYAGINLKPDGRKGHQIFFYKETLDKFKTRKATRKQLRQEEAKKLAI
jgi:predicted transcriptional regulator